MNVLVLSTADWHAPIWTNKQHIASRLADELRVTYVDSLGLRRPSLSRADLRRSMSRLVKRPISDSWADGNGAHGLTHVCPAIVPIHRQAFAALNRRLLRRALRTWLDWPQSERVLWTFSPVTYGLEHDAGFAVYHCVDILEHFKGVDATAIRRGEERLAAAGIGAIASSAAIARHLRSRGFERVDLWENVADVPLFGDARHAHRREPGLMTFAGNLTAQKVDFETLHAIIESNPHGRLKLIGPIADAASGRAVRRLLLNRRVTYDGPATQASLAQVFSTATVGLIPYLRNGYTRGVFPMKLYEYLAAGLAVVSTGLDSLPRHRDVLVAGSPDEAARLTSEVLSAPDHDVIERRFRFASEHSWDVRIRQVMERISRTPDSSARVPDLVGGESAASWT